MLFLTYEEQLSKAINTNVSTNTFGVLGDILLSSQIPI
jgi:hypothetical protein